MLRSEIVPRVALVPFTAASWVAIWDTCPAPHPLSATAPATPQASRPPVRPRTRGAGREPEVRGLKRSIQASCSPTRRPCCGRGGSTMHSSRWRLGTVAEGWRRLGSYLEAVRQLEHRARKTARAVHVLVSPSSPALHRLCP